MDSCNMELCRICITSHTNATQMISIFGEDLLWQKITTLADVKIEKGDTLPQQVCVPCAKNAIAACLFKKKCEDADNFFRQQLLIQKIENKLTNGKAGSLNSLNFENNIVVLSETEDNLTEEIKLKQEQKLKEQQHRLSQQEKGNSDDENDHREDHDNDVPRNQDDLKGPPQGGENENGLKGHQGLGNGLTMNGLMPMDENDLKNLNAKAAFDLNSLRLMQQYMMQQQFGRMNGNHMMNGHEGQNGGNGSIGSDGEGMGDCGDGDEDGDPLPLIPEIELITPSEEINSNGQPNGMMSSNGPLRGYQCPTCYQIFEMKQILKAHMQSVHGTAGPVYECNNCKKTYFYKRFLEKHIRRGRCVKKRRNQTRPMQCSDCHVIFPTGHHLGWHKRTGCPSKTAKMPLQQLFRQNIVQYNNFPKRIGIRKPENALYLHNRKILAMTNKRKGRTRIKLDAKKIALAKQLILREATTTVIANELQISRTFAWRLRKSLVNGVSLHERVVDQNGEEAIELPTDAEMDAQQQYQQQQQQQHQHLQMQQHQQDQNLHLSSDEVSHEVMVNPEDVTIKEEKPDSEEEAEDEHDEEDDDEEDDDDDDDDESSDDSSSDESQNNSHENPSQNSHQKNLRSSQNPLNHSENHNDLEEDHSPHDQEQHHQRLQQNQNHSQDSEEDDDDDDNEDDEDDNDEDEDNHSLRSSSMKSSSHHDHDPLQPIELDEQQRQLLVQQFPHIVNAASKNSSLTADLQKLASNLNSQNALPLLSQFPPAVAAALHQLPVNLSIRPIASMQNHERSSSSSGKQSKKPRKPNVFIDDEKYAMAKILVAQDASTMEIARALNVSQMTAWKVRDAIVKGLPLSYRNKRDARGPLVGGRHDTSVSPSASVSSATSSSAPTIAAVETQPQPQQHQVPDLQEQQQLQQLKHQQQLIEQKHQQMDMKKQQQLEQLQQQQQQLQLLQRQQLKQQQQLESEQVRGNGGSPVSIASTSALPVSSSSSVGQSNGPANGGLNPRKRLKAYEREVRDKEITREILDMIREDSNIQYWKVSAKLAEKGYAVSPSSVCQKLKSMGIHRRWKPGDKPPMLDMEHFQKVNTSHTNGLNSSNNASSADESCEPQQFELGGAHFLSAFSR